MASKSRIKSTVPLRYDRDKKKDIVYITIDKWLFDTDTQSYTALIMDYVKVLETIETNETIEKFVEINRKNKTFSKLQVDTLFKILNNPIEVGENYTDEMSNLFTNALLIVTQTDLNEDGESSYGSQPNEWIIDKN